MPLRWEILHPQKLIHIVAEGPVTLKEMEEHFDALVVANVLAMGARLSAYTATMPSGPLAVVAPSVVTQNAFRRFVNISPSRRPAAMFGTEAEARTWLATQANP